MTERKQWWGWGGGPEANNLVYTKRQKPIYAIRKHETTASLDRFLIIIIIIIIYFS